MSKNKLSHFEENKSFNNFYQPEFEEIKDDYSFKGSWSERHFNNTNPLILELGCGKGEYTIGLAKKYKQINFIGLDKKGARMWRGAKTSQLENILNVAFLRIKIEQLYFCFGDQEVDEIWITFPDPVPKVRRITRRLTSPKFLEIYGKILKPGGIVHLKTDNDEFFDYSMDAIESSRFSLVYHTYDLYESGFAGDAPLIQTYYEQKYLNEGMTIKYLQLKLSK